MTRTYVASNVWTNSEDVVLQAAISKYGLHNWSTVCTMIHGKTAAECKARWYDYLSPAVKKSQWLPEDEKRLIELVQALPNQWTTISAQLHRSTDQCIEQYKKLSRIALGTYIPKTQAQPHDSTSTQLSSSETADSAKTDNIRSILQTLNYNSRAENRPARADAADLDEGELEMLQTAQARIANTAGKKDKRRIREQSLQDAKDLAKLARFRQLEAAGIKAKVPTAQDADLIADVSRLSQLHGTQKGELFDVSSERTKEQSERASISFVGKKVTDIEGLSKNQQLFIGKQKQQEKAKADKQKNVAEFIVKQSQLNDNIVHQDRGKLSLSEDQIISPMMGQISDQTDIDVVNGNSAHLQQVTSSILKLRQVDDGRQLFKKEGVLPAIKGENGPQEAQKRTFAALNSSQLDDPNTLAPTTGVNSRYPPDHLYDNPKGTKRQFLQSNLQDLLSELPSTTAHTPHTPHTNFDLKSELVSLPHVKKDTNAPFSFNLLPESHQSPSYQHSTTPQAPQIALQSSGLRTLKQSLADLQIDASLQSKILSFYSASALSSQHSTSTLLPSNLANHLSSIKPIIPHSSQSPISCLRSYIVPSLHSFMINDLSPNSQMQVQQLLLEELSSSLNTIGNHASNQHHTQLAQQLIKQELLEMNHHSPLEKVQIDFSQQLSTNTTQSLLQSTEPTQLSDQPAMAQIKGDHLPNTYFNPASKQFVAIPIQQLISPSIASTLSEQDIQNILRQEALKLKIWLQQLIFQAGQTNDPNILAKGDKKGSVEAKLEKRAKVEFKGYLAKNEKFISQLFTKHAKYLELIHQYEYMTALLNKEEEIIKNRADRSTHFLALLSAEQQQLQQIYLKRSRQ